MLGSCLERFWTKFGNLAQTNFYKGSVSYPTSRSYIFLSIWNVCSMHYNCSPWETVSLWHVTEAVSNSNMFWNNGKKNAGINSDQHQDHPDYSIVKISQNTEKGPGDMWRIAVTYIPVKDHSEMTANKTQE